MSAFEPRPVRLGVGVATLLALVAVGAVAARPTAAGVAALGAVLVAVGAVRGVTAVLALGTLAQLTAVVLAGVAGGSAPELVVATTAALLAWDTATQAVDLGQSLGRAADVRRPLLVHLAGGLLLSGAVGTAGYAVFRVAGGGQPVAALALVLAGALALSFVLQGS